jgi:phosphate transport system substrate-binding protein
MTKKWINIFFAISLIYIIGGCEQEKKETPTKGYVKCLVDESLINVIEDERKEFLELYKDAKIDLQVVKAREGIASVLNGEAKMFVSSRAFNKEERDFIEKTKSDVTIYKFCLDGLTVIANYGCLIDSIKIEELNDILLGKSKKFSIFLPEANSGIYEVVKNDFLNGKNPTGSEILNSEKDVIEKVTNTKNSIGLVGLNSLKDYKRVRILKVGSVGNVFLKNAFYEPIPGYLVNGSYPLVRTTYVILNEIGVKVASGFTAFLTSYEGQKIVLKNNLGPATVPVKLRQ